MLKAILGMEKAAYGKVVLEGENVTSWLSSRRIKDGLALMLEGPLFLISQTIEENLLLGGYQRDDMDAERSVMEVIYERFPNPRERSHVQAS